jgi:hypothetical protein
MGQRRPAHVNTGFPAEYKLADSTRFSIRDKYFVVDREQATELFSSSLFLILF